ncbi:MAG: hypothetical protein WAX14_21965 [Rhodococcus sp. (in: high G+C Gram-positive bacteria)]|uniref:hypothetical protein n=1 Tax=Rhodococcus sp. TaxID=1831 RepID=UPI003BB7B55F
MSWDEYRRRTAALDAVLERAAKAGQVTLPYADVPGVAEVFATEADLLAALRAKWFTLYRGFLDQESFAGERAGASADEIARSARMRVDVVQPDLRRLIDHNSPVGSAARVDADHAVRLEASGGGGLPFPTWSSYAGESSGPKGVGAEIASLVVLLLFGFVLWAV